MFFLPAAGGCYCDQSAADDEQSEPQCHIAILSRCRDIAGRGGALFDNGIGTLYFSLAVLIAEILVAAIAMPVFDIAVCGCS